MQLNSDHIFEVQFTVWAPLEGVWTPGNQYPPYIQSIFGLGQIYALAAVYARR